MLAEEAYWAVEADKHTTVDECAFEPARALEAVVDEFAMAAERMAEEEHDGCADDEQCEGGP
jgi:hypothetical protein